MFSRRESIGTCHARIGFMGNPSDGFEGKTMSFLLENFAATVRIEEQDLSKGIDIHDSAIFSDATSLIHQSINIVSFLLCWS